jgi:hypothetical protein
MIACREFSALECNLSAGVGSSAGCEIVLSRRYLICAPQCKHGEINTTPLWTSCVRTDDERKQDGQVITTYFVLRPAAGSKSFLDVAAGLGL